VTHAAIMVTGKRLLALERPDGPGARPARAIARELPPEAEARGAEIARILKEQGWSAPRATLVVPRHRVLVRRLSVPDGSAEEIDQMVGIQLERELDLPLAEARFSYEVGPADAQGQRDVTAVALRAEELASMSAMLASAGVQIESVVVSTWGLAAATAADEPSALAVLEPDFGEVVILRGGRPLAARSFEGVAAEAVVAELSRTLPALEAQAGTGPVARLDLWGRHHQAAVQALAQGWKDQRTATRCACVSSLPGDVPEAALVPLWGAAAARARGERSAGPDLLRERVRASRWKPHRKKLIAGATAAAFLLLWGVSRLWLWIGGRELDGINEEFARDKAKVEQLSELEARGLLLDQWTVPRVSAAWVQRAVLDCERATRRGEWDRVLYVTDVSLVHAVVPAGPRRQKEELKLSLHGRAKTEQAVMKFADALRDRAGVTQVEQPPLVNRPQEGSFSVSFDLKATLRPNRWTYQPETAKP
jgi:hypothetical protein